MRACSRRAGRSARSWGGASVGASRRPSCAAPWCTRTARSWRRRVSGSGCCQDERRPGACCQMNDALTIEADPSDKDIQELRHQLYRYNVASLDGLEGDTLAIFVRGPDGELQGGIYGWTWAGWLEINLLWVHEQQRGRGLGSRLLAAAEAEGQARGAHTALLDTHTFQAPAFYQQHGYEVYATVEGYPPGHSKLFFRKRLTAEQI